jgi:L-aspartate oxidase
MVRPISSATGFAASVEAIASPTRCADDVPSAPIVRDLMWRHAGLLRSRDTLDDLVDRLTGWWAHLTRKRSGTLADREFRQLSSLVTVGLLIARAAVRREESRGGHFRTDFPRRDDIHWQKHVADVISTDRPGRA